MADDLFDSAGRARLERLRARVSLLENQLGDLAARIPTMRREAGAVGAALDEMIAGEDKSEAGDGTE